MTHPPTPNTREGAAPTFSKAELKWLRGFIGMHYENTNIFAYGYKSAMRVLAKLDRMSAARLSSPEPETRP